MSNKQQTSLKQTVQGLTNKLDVLVNYIDELLEIQEMIEADVEDRLTALESRLTILEKDNKATVVLPQNRLGNLERIFILTSNTPARLDESGLYYLVHPLDLAELITYTNYTVILEGSEVKVGGIRFKQDTEVSRQLKAFI